MITKKVTNTPMMQILAKTAILCIVPKTIDVVTDFFFKTDSDKKEIPVGNTPILTHKDLNLAIEAKSKKIEKNIIKTIKKDASSFNYAGNTINKSASKDASRFVDAQKKSKKKKVHSTHDTTVFTNIHVRHIKQRYKETDLYKIGKLRVDWFTREDLKNLLNYEFGIDKGGTSYSDVSDPDLLLGNFPIAKKKTIIIHPEFSAKSLVEIIQEYPSKQYH